MHLRPAGHWSPPGAQPITPWGMAGSYVHAASSPGTTRKSKSSPLRIGLPQSATISRCVERRIDSGSWIRRIHRLDREDPAAALPGGERAERRAGERSPSAVRVLRPSLRSRGWHGSNIMNRLRSTLVRGGLLAVVAVGLPA